MRIGTFLVPALSLLTLHGCGNWNSVYHTHDFTTDGAAIVDIKQRAIVSSPQGIVCAEPSPDALATYAGELAAKSTVAGKTPVELAGAYQEAAAFVGMRSQTIQLLRDQLFRLCEAKMNGVIDTKEYQMLLARNQRYTVALMAIEQLTGSTQVPIVALASTSSAALVNDVELAEKQLKEAEAEKSKIETEAKGKSTPEQTAEIDSLKGTIGALKMRIEKGRSAIASGTTTQYVGTYTGNSLDAAAAYAAVSSIATKAFEQSDADYLCFNELTTIAGQELQGTRTTSAQGVLIEYCRGRLIKGKGPVFYHADFKELSPEAAAAMKAVFEADGKVLEYEQED